MVSIITVNYNGWKDTCELLTSLKQFETYPYEVIVVDNASQGSDAKLIKQAHPDVTVINSDTNLGFAGGNNWGYRFTKGDYIFFLNNDMIVKAPMLAPMVARLENPMFAGVSPCIVFLYKPDMVQYYGYHDMTPITLKHTTESFDIFNRECFLQPHETEVLHGGAMMVRRDVIENIGTMTEDYFLFYEEFDWSRRMREAGYKLYYEPASVVYHKGSMTIKTQTPLREYYLTRARMIYARRNCRGFEKVVACMYQLFLVAPKKILFYLLCGKPKLAEAVGKGVICGLFKAINRWR